MNKTKRLIRAKQKKQALIYNKAYGNEPINKKNDTKENRKVLKKNPSILKKILKIF